MNRFVIISGCSGGGKSTLLAELSRRGHATVEEPGRRIVAEERLRGGSALPWIDMAGFARRAVTLSLRDRRQAIRNAGDGWVFFDRGLIDAALAWENATAEPVLATLAEQHPYHRTVFLTPPWPDIYAADKDRQHGFAEAVAEFDRLADIYPRLGYRTLLLPKSSVGERADFVMAHLPAFPP
ncbi:AAA family ATPase [Rhizobiaceae bacterium BDR2-2]|uniref:AAA family ATPase n=1 Tax=Ectorhizobium quercum TaxID=2965071 RepID=A0AAE3MYI9_9HYPH|nr:AAA family ATPase [Ectorhizobium quercum]MCX8996702.1 AAA family ATPase [Ectorhizobium quercum]